MPFDPSKPFELVTEASPASGFDPSQPFEPVAPATYLSAAPAKSFTSTALETVREFLSPLLGPTEQQRLRDSVEWTDEHGNQTYLYKPLGDKVAQEGFTPALSHPAVELPKFKHEGNDSKVTSIGKALGNTGLGFVEFMESPLGVATGGAGKLLGGRAVAGAFAGDLALKAPEAVQQTRQTVADPNASFGQKAEAVIGTGAQITLAGTLGASAAGLKFRPANREAANLERELAAGDKAPSISATITEPAKPAETDAQRFARERREASDALRILKEQETQQADLTAAVDQVRQQIIARQTKPAWERPKKQPPAATDLTKGGESNGQEEIQRRQALLESQNLPSPEGASPENVPATITGSNEVKASEMPAEAGASPAPEQSFKPRHLEEARQILREQERPPDIFDDLDTVGSGPIKFPTADFADALTNVRDALSQNRYGRPYDQLRRPQRELIDKQHRLSTDTGTPADRALVGLAENPKYAGWSPDNLAVAMTVAAVRRAKSEPSEARVKQVASDVANAERQRSTAESWADQTIAAGRKRLHAGLDPELLAAYAVKGAYIVARGVRDFAAWSAEMVQALPELAKASEAQLRELFAHSTDISDGRDPKIGLSIRGMKLRADQDLSAAVRGGANAEYQKRTSAGDQGEANQLIVEAGGPEQAAAAILAGKWDTLPEPVAVKAAGKVLRMLADLERRADPARADSLAQKQVDIANWSTRNATRPAQWLQSFSSLYAEYSPAAWLKEWRKGVYEVARQRLERATRQAVPEDVVGQARTVAGQVAEGLKPDAPTAADVIGDVFGGKGKPGETLAEAVTRRTGKTGETARKLARKISDLYEREVTKFRKRHKIPELTPEEEREVLRRAKAIEALPAESLQRRKAALELMDALHKRKGFAWWELPVAFWYANVLSGPTTHAKNILGNAVNLGMEASLQSVLKPTNIPAMLESVGRSMAAGGREAASIIRTGHDTAARHGDKFELKRNVIELQTNPTFDKLLLPWKLVGRLLRAEDAVFFNAAQEMRAAILSRRAAGESTAGMREAMGWTPEARTKAQAQATHEGLTGLDYQRRVNEIIEQARPETVMQAAREFGYDATFNQDPYGVLGSATNMLNHFFDKHPLFKPFILPFTRIVANVSNSALNWTPIGAVRAARGQRRLAWLGSHDSFGKLYGREITDPLAIRDAYARATIGTAAVVGLTAAALQNVFDDDPKFLITASGPNSKDQRNLLRAAGWIPYSIKIGNRYYSYQDKTPQMVLAMIGHYVDAVRYKNLNREDALNRTTYALQGMAGVVVSSSWLQGLSSLFDQANRDTTRNPSKGLAQQVIRTSSSFAVPAALRQLDQLYDPTKYKAEDIQGMLLAQVPWARRSGQPDLNAFGQPVSSPTSKIFWSKVEGDALVRRLAGQRLFPAVPEQSDLTAPEHYALLKLRGPLMRAALLENADEWMSQPRMIAQDAVNRLSAAATREAKEQLGLDEASQERRALRKMTTR